MLAACAGGQHVDQQREGDDEEMLGRRGEPVERVKEPWTLSIEQLNLADNPGHARPPTLGHAKPVGMVSEVLMLY
ncbi:unnamed protein product [Brugia timori]|uniref:Uncharacterized protein n=1 Tax=Brugia timori TaxID=42155 RepID=A0A3P7SVK4_9BILA|nr:unnamed protein product [Brugia timori]